MSGLLQNQTLVIATHNKGKAQEIGELLAALHIRTISAAEANVDEPEETGKTFAENAELKAHHACAKAKLPALADDSGLVIPALDGAPGIYSARWAGADKNFAAAFTRIESELAAKHAASPVAAYFNCTLCLAFPDGKSHVFEGRIDGHLTFPPRGNNGFGYDPIFTANGYDITFGEMAADAKNRISHRAQAFAKFLTFLKGNA